LMADEWFLASKGKGYGPFSTLQLQQMAEAGVIDADDLVWRDGDSESAPASTVGNEPPPLPVASSRPSPPPLPLPNQQAPSQPQSKRRRGMRVVFSVLLLGLLGTGGWFAFETFWQPIAANKLTTASSD